MIVLKASVDAKSGQLVRRVKFASGQKVRFFGNINFTALQMKALGDIAIGVIKDRVSRGIGSDDAPMKPLSGKRSAIFNANGKFARQRAGYAEWKQKRGGQPIRDLTLTGAMLRNFTVRSVSETQVRMDITSQKERVKARANEQRSPWFGWSPRDLIEITAAGERLFKKNIAGMGIGGGKQGPVWMDPYGNRFRDAVRRAA